VPWSSFISGMNPGGHGLFDFLARKTGIAVDHLVF
jgi:predicted AlkP superfamily phosphohydrolase/phosphomutase